MRISPTPQSHWSSTGSRKSHRSDCLLSSIPPSIYKEKTAMQNIWSCWSIFICTAVFHSFPKHLSLLPRPLTEGIPQTAAGLPHHSPAGAAALPELAHTAGTSLPVCEGSWESIIIPCACHLVRPATAGSTDFVDRSDSPASITSRWTVFLRALHFRSKHR